MCDTFVATPEFTGTGNLIFGKNSDREPNEAQAIVRIPARKTTERQVRCTYISVPQVAETYEIILSKPFQMWGAEMGANEHGVVIGNEAVFTKVKIQKKDSGLTGMDLIRLALERSKTAQAALQTITELLEQHGQDVCGGYLNRGFYYHNSFIIADASEAWVLETAGKHWVAIRAKGFRAISNGLTIESEYDLASKDVVGFARAQGWTRQHETFNFAKAYSDWFYTRMGRCKIRRSTMNRLGQAKSHDFGVRQAMEILQDHAGQRPEEFQPDRSDTGYLCMHSTGITNPSQTTGAWVAEVRAKGPSTHWLTGTAGSCISVFKPFFFSGTALLEGQFAQPGASPDGSLWWRHEEFHRAALKDYRNSFLRFRDDLTSLQEKLLAEEASLIRGGASPEALDALSLRALAESDQALGEWMRKIAAPVRAASPFRAPLYRLYWGRMNRLAGLKAAGASLGASRTK